MSETWYKISSYSVRIQRVEVVKATEYFVTYKRSLYGGGWRETREKRDGQFFKTFAEAKTELIDRYEKSVQAAKDSLQIRRSYLGQAKSLTEEMSYAQ